MKVDFMIIGAQKCATTTLTQILKSHPSVSFCKEDEPHFFSKNSNWKEHLAEYNKLFETKNNVLYGEGSTSYTFYKNDDFKVWEHLHEYNPDLKFIYLVRNPIDRIISAYMHAFSRGYTSKDIETEVLQNQFYINVSKYFFQISPFIELFGRDKVLLIDFDDFNKNRAAQLEHVAAFLGIDKSLFKNFENVKANESIGGSKVHHKWDNYFRMIKSAGKLFPHPLRQLVFDVFFRSRQFDEKPILSEKAKQKIIQDLLPDIRNLELLMNRSYEHWMKI
ncbi:MAG: sulfotransferase [Chitinophagales bacterium]|nr:sulfotransferase [Chitinophagales bacterium]